MKLFVNIFSRRALNKFEEDPDTYESLLEEELSELLETEPELAQQLAKLVKDYESALKRQQLDKVMLGERAAVTGKSSDTQEKKQKPQNPEVDYLQAAMKAYTAQMEQKLREASVKTPGTPYKGLFYFEMTDEQIFFGREQQIEQLLERIQV